MQNLFKLSATLCSALLLSACDPAFQTTAQKCAQGQELEIVIPVADPKYQVLVDADEYELYMRESIEVMTPTTSLSVEQQEAKTFLDQQIVSFLAYEKSGDSVTGARNPLDFLEALINTTDPDLEIEAFVLAKRQLAEGIAEDDDFCSFRNENVRLVNSSDSSDAAYAIVTMSYSPFTRIVSQEIVASENRDDLNDLSPISLQSVPFVGSHKTSPGKFKAVGFPNLEQRALTTNNPEQFASFDFVGNKFNFDEEFFELRYVDQFCNVGEGSDTSTWEDCSNGETTRTPQRTECTHEADKVEVNNFHLNASYPAAKRLRVEVDYSDDNLAEVRFYASNYVSAIEDEDGNTVEDPTGCEITAIREARNSNTDIPVADPNYDNVYQTDSNGNAIADGNGDLIIETPATPIFTYQGTVSAIRN